MTGPYLIARLRDELAWSRRRDAKEAWALIAVGLVFVALYAALGHGGLLAVGVGAIVLAVFLGLFFLWLGGRSSVIDRLERRADDVVWVYARVGATSARNSALYFGFSDGSGLDVAIRPTSSDALIESASLAFPTATIGFTGDAQRRFMHDPASLRVPARQRSLRVRPSERETAWLVPFARATLLKTRVLGWLGVVIAALGGLGFIIVIAASSGGERLGLSAVFAVVATLGGALAVPGFRRFEGSPLHAALTTGDGLADVRLVEGPDGAGDIIPLAMVTLTSGRRYTFWVDVPPPAREARQ